MCTLPPPVPVQLALYKGPATQWLHKLTHWAICLATLSRYSHCELVSHGVCLSSSARDGGVRAKDIDLTDGHWDVIPLPGVSAEDVWQWFADHDHCKYDWAGALRFVLPFLPQRPDQYFCSEACAAALGLPRPSSWTPGELAAFYIDWFGVLNERDC